MLAQTPLGFYKSPITKIIIFSLFITSLLFSLLKFQPYLFFQINPHLTRYGQYWRLITSQLAFTQSGDVFLAGILYYRFRMLERWFGSSKYLVFFIFTIILSNILQTLTLYFYSPLNSISIPPGPFSPLFACLYIYYKIVPNAYHVKIGIFEIGDKFMMYFFILQIIILRQPAILLTFIYGILSGVLYYNNLLGIKKIKFPKSLLLLIFNSLGKFVDASPPKRSISATRQRSNPSRRRPNSSMSSDSNTSNNNDTVRQTIVSFNRPLTNPFNALNRTNSNREVQSLETLASLFPDQPREVHINALAAAGGNVGLATARLLEQERNGENNTNSMNTITMGQEFFQTMVNRLNDRNSPEDMERTLREYNSLFNNNNDDNNNESNTSYNSNNRRSSEDLLDLESNSNNR